MRYRHLSYRYAMVVRYGQMWPFGSDIWQSDRLRLLVQARWRPDADTYATPTAIEVVVHPPASTKTSFEVQVFDDGVVVEGRRQPRRGRGRVRWSRHRDGRFRRGAAVARQ